MLLTAYALGLDKELKRFTQQGFQDGNEKDTGSVAVGIFGLLIIILVVFVPAAAAAYLSYTLNKHLGTSTGLTVLYAIIAFIFSDFYVVGYSFFFNPLLKGGANKSRSLASANRRNTNA